MKQSLYFPAVMDETNDCEQRFVHFSAVRAETSLRLVQFGIHKTASNYGYGPCTREHHLLHFVFAGCGEVTVAGKHFPVKKNEMFFIPKDTISYYQADDSEPWMYSWIGFEGVAGDVALDIANLTADTPVAEIPQPARMEKIVNEMADNMFLPTGYFMLMSGLFRIMDELCRTHGRAPEHEKASTGRIRQPAAAQLNAVITRIEHEFEKELPVQKLADDVGLTRSYLSELFKKSTGMSIKEYITTLRMDMARMLLTESNSPVMNIAARVGYDDPLYFSRVFKKHTGKTPVEYRSKTDKK